MFTPVLELVVDASWHNYSSQILYYKSLYCNGKCEMSSTVWVDVMAATECNLGVQERRV